MPCEKVWNNGAKIWFKISYLQLFITISFLQQITRSLFILKHLMKDSRASSKNLEPSKKEKPTSRAQSKNQR